MVATLQFKLSLHSLGMGRKQAGFAHVLRVQCTYYITCKVNVHEYGMHCVKNESMSMGFA